MVKSYTNISSVAQTTLTFMRTANVASVSQALTAPFKRLAHAEVRIAHFSDARV